MGFWMVLVVKDLPGNAGDKETGFDPRLEKISEEEGQPSPVFLLEDPMMEEPGGL